MYFSKIKRLTFYSIIVLYSIGAVFISCFIADISSNFVNLVISYLILEMCIFLCAFLMIKVESYALNLKNEKIPQLTKTIRLLLSTAISGLLGIDNVKEISSCLVLLINPSVGLNKDKQLLKIIDKNVVSDSQEKVALVYDKETKVEYWWATNGLEIRRDGKGRPILYKIE